MQHALQPEQPDQNAVPLNNPNQAQLQMQAQQLLAISQQLRIEADNVAVHARQVELRSRELTDQAEQAQREVTRAEDWVSQLEARLAEPVLETVEQQQQQQQQQLRLQLQDQLAQARDRVKLAQARFTELQGQAQQAQMQARAAQTHSEQLRIHADRLQEQARGQANEHQPQPQPQGNIHINLPQQEIHVDIQPQVPAQDQAAPRPPNIRINIQPQNVQNVQNPNHVFIGDPNGIVIRHQIRIEVNRAGPAVTTELEPDHADWLQGFLKSLHRLTSDELNKLDPNEDICPICYDAFNNSSDNDDDEDAHRSDKIVVRIPQCGHVFDLVCLELWVKDHVTCPYCQRNLRR